MQLFKRKSPVRKNETESAAMGSSVSLDMAVLKKNNITRLTIDERWTRLFASMPMSPELEKAQAEMNELIKKEAVLKNEQDNLEPSKKKCMNQIISLTQEAFEHNSDSAKVKLKECKKEIERINGRMDKIMEEVEQIDNQLKEANINLLINSIHYIFTTLKGNKKRSKDIQEELTAIEKRQKELTEELESINVDWTSYAVNITELIGSDNVRTLEKEFGLEELSNETGNSGANA